MDGIQDFMAPLNPQGLPAPLWFLTTFKVIGFILHVWPMNLFYAGTLLAAVLLFAGGEQGRRLSGRLGRVLPFAVALGVNFGIVPLLFVQVSHYRVFYPTTILIAWAWFAVVPLLTIGYYGIYGYAYEVRNDRVGRFGRAAIALGALFFVCIGFIFANNFSLLTNFAGWEAIYAKTNLSGAVSGLALNTGDPILWPRWLMMFGLAICSTAAWVGIDTQFFAGGETDDYRAWAASFAAKLYGLGLVWFAVMGSWYIFGALDPDSRAFLFSGFRLPLTLLTAASPGLGLLAVGWLTRPGSPKRAWLVVAAHYAVIICNALSRQLLQTHKLEPLGILGAEQTHTQWSTLPVFLVCFVLTLWLVIWMLRKVWVEASLGESPATP